jgi:hypothetical protein
MRRPLSTALIAWDRFELRRMMVGMLAVVGLLSALANVGHLVTGQRALAAGAPHVFPLRLSANRRYLVDKNNAPFLIVGDVPQTLVTRLTPTDAAQYVEDRAAHGFNSLWINVLTAGPYYHASRNDGGTYDGILPFTGYLGGEKDLAHYDLSRPNEQYFARVDQMLNLATDYGMLVFLDPIETGQWLPTLKNNGAERAFAYGQYVGRRYGHFDNIVWLSGNDFGQWKKPEVDAVVLAVAKGIQSVAPDQMQTVELHVGKSSSADDPEWIPLISLNGAYAYQPTYFQVWHSYGQTPVMPAFLLEGHYDFADNNPDVYGTPSVLRRQEYWTMLSGGTGQLYGNSYTDEFLPGWRDYVDTTGVAQLMFWRSFFSSLPWQNLVPDQDHTVVTAGFGNPGGPEDRANNVDFCTAARSEDGTVVIAYMPTPREITVDMARLKGAAAGAWFDPVNGSYIAIPGGPIANSGLKRFVPPRKVHDDDGDGDWVLLLDASGRSF